MKNTKKIIISFVGLQFLFCAGTVKIDGDCFLFNSNNFPKQFEFGRLDWGVDCEYFQFSKNNTFLYKFYGDCHGGGRQIAGTWDKEGNKIIFKSTLIEGPSEAEAHCLANHGHEKSLTEIKECEIKYIKNIKEKYGKDSVNFIINGFVEIDEGKAKVTLSSNTIIEDKKINGPLEIEGDRFSCFKVQE